jgi:hypothetical protein
MSDAQKTGGTTSDKRYRLSVDTEIIETERFAGVVHVHKRTLDVFEYETLEAAKDAQSKFVSRTSQLE